VSSPGPPAPIAHRVALRAPPLPTGASGRSIGHPDLTQNIGQNRCSTASRSRSRGTVDTSLALIDDLERQIDRINRQLRAGSADHPYLPLLLTVPGIGWVLAFTIAAEIGDIARFSSAKKLCGYTGLCPRVNQSGDKDRRGPLTKHGPKYPRWAPLEATTHALRHPAYNERHQRNKRRLGKQRGAKDAQIDIARKLTEAIWHMLTNNQPFAPAPGGATDRLAASRPPLELRPRSRPP
jgi:transposase